MYEYLDFMDIISHAVKTYAQSGWKHSSHTRRRCTECILTQQAPYDSPEQSHCSSTIIK